MSQSPQNRRRDDPRMHTVEMAALPALEERDLEGLVVPRERITPSVRATALLVAGGGALGALLRETLEVLLPTVSTASLQSVPWPTLIANTLGCLGIGVLAGYVETRRDLPWWVQPFVGTGLLAGFTTIALVVLQVSAMIGGDVAMLALEYALASSVLPLGAAVAGLVGGRALGRRR